MKNSLYFFLLLFLVGCASLPSARIPASSTGLLTMSKQSLPDAEALGAWRDVPGYQTSSIDVTSLAAIKVDCESHRLYPTHPQQTTKLYHLFKSAVYDQSKLKSGDEACKIGSKYKNASGVMPCLMADYAQYAVLSDTYQDACGHYYRGVWDVAFLKQNDSMGLLFAKGRTLYEKPDSAFANDMYVAQTYPVDAEEFLLVTPLFNGDAEQISVQRKAAETTHSYDPVTHLFLPR